MEIGVIILNILWTISFFSTLSMATAFHLSGKNPLVKIFCITTALMSLNVLFSIVFDNQLEKAPKAFCFFQGLFLQFNTFAQDISALCFSIHVYRLIVLKINDTSIRIKKRYYIACAVYTITFTTILGIVASHTDSIQPRKMNCDVLRPAYVRLLGYSGVNVVFAIPGVYFSGHSAYMVFRHLERFRTISLKSSSNKSSNPTLTDSQDPSKIDSSNHNDVHSSDIENNKEKKNEHELESPPSPPLPPLPLAILSDNEDNDTQLLDDEDDNGNVSNNNEYELMTLSSPILTPPPVFSNDNEESIISISSYYNGNYLLDGEGNKDNLSDNNEYGLSTLPSPLLPPPPPPSAAFFDNNNNNNEVNINNNHLNETKIIIKNIRVNSIIVNKDNNKDSYVRVNSTDNNNNDGGNSSSSKTINKVKNTNASQNQQKTSTEVIQKKTYNTTKSAAKRMALFCLFFIIINFLGSITTLKVALTGEEFKPSIQPNDIIGSMIGIIVTSVFCTSSEIKRLKSIFIRR